MITFAVTLCLLILIRTILLYFLSPILLTSVSHDAPTVPFSEQNLHPLHQKFIEFRHLMI